MELKHLEESVNTLNNFMVKEYLKSMDLNYAVEKETV